MTTTKLLKKVPKKIKPRNIFTKGNLVVCKSTNTIVIVNKEEDNPFHFSGQILFAGPNVNRIGGFSVCWDTRAFEQFTGGLKVMSSYDDFEYEYED